MGEFSCEKREMGHEKKTIFLTRVCRIRILLFEQGYSKRGIAEIIIDLYSVMSVRLLKKKNTKTSVVLLAKRNVDKPIAMI